MPTPTLPFRLMERAVIEDVAKVEGDAVATYKLPLMLLNVHGFEVKEVSESASCGPVDEARCKFQRGVEVPMPTRCAPALKIASVSVVDVAHLLAALPLPEPHALAFAETVPFAPTCKQRVPVPPVFDMTRADVDAVPLTARFVVVAFVVVDLVTTKSCSVVSPRAEMERNLVAFDDDATSKSGLVWPTSPWSASFAHGVEVPMPTLSALSRRNDCVPSFAQPAALLPFMGAIMAPEKLVVIAVPIKVVSDELTRSST